jgi:hypothetical protein
MGNIPSNPAAVPITATNIPESYKEILRGLANSYRDSTRGTSTYIEPSKQLEIEDITARNPYRSLSQVNADYASLIRKYTIEYPLMNHPVNLLHIKEGRTTPVLYLQSARRFVNQGVSIQEKQAGGIPEDATLRTMTFTTPGTDADYERYMNKIQEAKERHQISGEETQMNKKLMKNVIITGTELGERPAFYSNDAQMCMNSAVETETMYPGKVVAWSYDISLKQCKLLATIAEERLREGYTSGTIQGYKDAEANPQFRVSPNLATLNLLRDWIPPTSQTQISRPFEQPDGTIINTELTDEIKQSLQMLYYLHVNQSQLLNASQLQQEKDKNENEATPGRLLRLVAFLKSLRDYNSQIQSSIVAINRRKYFRRTSMETQEAFTTTTQEQIQDNSTAIETSRQSLNDYTLKTREIYEKNQITLAQVTDAQAIAQTQFIGFLLSVGFLVLVSGIPSSSLS